MIFSRRIVGAGSEGGGSRAGDGGDGEGNMGDENESADARVLRFDPAVRERRKQPSAVSKKSTLSRRGAVSGSGSASASRNAPSSAREPRTFKVHLFRAFQLTGVLFALVIMVRSCGG